MDVPELLRSVRARQDSFAEAKRLYRDRLAPDFTPFDFINPEEMGLSRILAWLLKGGEASHGQGGRFLHLFVTKLFDGSPGSAWPLEACERAKAWTEFVIDGGRRVDVLVRSGERTLLIENKAGAGDQPSQVSSYAAYLDGLNQADTRLVYLTPDVSKPSDTSINEQKRIERTNSGQLHCWSYSEHVLPWLTECRAACRADRVSTFIDEFARHIRKRFEGAADMTMRDQLVEDVTRSADMVGPAMQVILAADAIRARLLQNLCNQLKDAIAKHEGWSLDWKVSASSKYGGFAIGFSSGSKYTFSVSFENASYNSLIYGVKTKDAGPEFPANAGGASEAVSAHLGSGKQNEWWTWYRAASLEETEFEVEPHWGLSQRPWVAISDGTMAKIIMRTASRLRDVLARCNLL